MHFYRKYPCYLEVEVLAKVYWQTTEFQANSDFRLPRNVKLLVESRWIAHHPDWIFHVLTLQPWRLSAGVQPVVLHREQCSSTELSSSLSRLRTITFHRYIGVRSITRGTIKSLASSHIFKTQL